MHDVDHLLPDLRPAMARPYTTAAAMPPRRKRPHEEPDGPWDLCIVLTSIAGLLTLFIWLAGNELGAEIVHDL